MGFDSRPGYTLSVSAELPGAVLALKKVEVTRASTLEGRKLDCTAAPRQTVTRGPSQLLTNVSLDIPLGELPLESRGLAEVSGILECERAENQRAVELISGKLKAGAKGQEFDSEIEFIGSHIAGGEKLVLKTTLPPEQLQSVRVVEGSGRAVKLEKRSMMRVGDRHSYTWISTGSIPRTGRVVADVLSGSETVRIPFAIRNLSLLGQPLAKVE